jgi:hypothetical protein
MNDSLRATLRAKLDDVDAPAGDPTKAIESGRRQRRRRYGAVVAVASTTVMAIGLVTLEPGSETPNRQRVAKPSSYVTVAAFDATHGIRAFADPAQDGLVHLGDRSYPKTDMDYLDTDASATPHGVVFFDRDQKPRLLSPDGRVVPLGDGPRSATKGFHPSSKFDPARPYVAWTEHHSDRVTVVLYDLKARSPVATRDIGCSPTTCTKVKVDSLDHGVVFVRTAKGTFVWRLDGSWTQLGGPKLRVADVRGGTLLYAGEAPTLKTDDWRYVPGAIDAQLTFDGKNVLYWSNELKPTTQSGRAIRLNAGSKDAGWYTLDTDGSILVASTTRARSESNMLLEAAVFDCEVPSGSCTKIGQISTEGGDPMFIGDDM